MHIHLKKCQQQTELSLPPYTQVTGKKKPGYILTGVHLPEKNKWGQILKKQTLHFCVVFTSVVNEAHIKRRKAFDFKLIAKYEIVRSQKSIKTKKNFYTTLKTK